MQAVNANEDIPDYVKQELFQKFFDKHLKETLKTKIPVLHNLTPKQCLKKDPETFYKWLEDFKQNVLEQTERLYDFSWFLEELGV